ncbi:SAM-dependent methyltransferase [Actinopolyspora saharensis]|uniref:SAM-dependent methyltransferase n=1 Tax=Actinopolyspora saharensis TaxID=995062 RepID=UPI003F671682
MSNPTEVGSAIPSTDVESAYELFAPLAEKYWGPDLHNGYWYGEQDDTSLEEASRRLTELVADRLRVGPGDRVLDVGCGNGRPAVSVGTGTGAQVTGVDVNRSALAAASEHAAANGLGDRVAFECADALDLPFRPGSFDAALLIESSLHFELDELLPSLAGMLRPAGRLVLETPYAKVPMNERMRQRTAEYYEMIQAVSLDTLPRHLEVAGAVGLEPVEFLDITENTAQTWPRALERLRENWSEIERVLGSEVAERAVRVVDDWRAVPEIGFMVMTLRRRERDSEAG